MPDAFAYHATLLGGHWFAGLPGPLRDSLLGMARVRQLSAGQRLFCRGDPPCGTC